MIWIDGVRKQFHNGRVWRQKHGQNEQGAVHRYDNIGGRQRVNDVTQRVRFSGDDEHLCAKILRQSVREFKLVKNQSCIFALEKDDSSTNLRRRPRP